MMKKYLKKLIKFVDWKLDVYKTVRSEESLVELIAIRTVLTLEKEDLEKKANKIVEENSHLNLHLRNIAHLCQEISKKDEALARAKILGGILMLPELFPELRVKRVVKFKILDRLVIILTEEIEK